MDKNGVAKRQIQYASRIPRDCLFGKRNGRSREKSSSMTNQNHAHHHGANATSSLDDGRAIDDRGNHDRGNHDRGDHDCGDHDHGGLDRRPGGGSIVERRGGPPAIIVLLSLLAAAGLGGPIVDRFKNRFSLDPLPINQPGDSAAVDHSIVLDLNRADERELCLLPGIGPAVAGRIVRDRDERGDFRDLQSVARIAGIGPATLRQIEPYCVFLPTKPSPNDVAGNVVDVASHR